MGGLLLSLVGPLLAQSSPTVSVLKSAVPDPVLTDSDLTYTLVVRNNSSIDIKSATMTDPLPADTTFVSLSVASGWSCTAPSVGGGGLVSCSLAPFPPGDANFTLVVHVSPDLAGGSSLTNTATLDVIANGRPESAVGTAVVGVRSPATLSATKSVTGNPVAGAVVTYTLVLTNTASHAQGDGAGPELTDTLPAELTLVSASATSGIATTAGNTVQWNGSLAASESVTLSILARVNDVPGGTVIANQASFVYDADGDGTNETAGLSDDPATATAVDPTAFVVQLSLAAIPTLNLWGLGLVAALLMLAAWRRLGVRAR
ncbi:MAG: hypothetical protein ABI609_02460 [Acidobacteriota bacterium]